jgi:hypothetical protein
MGAAEAERTAHAKGPGELAAGDLRVDPLAGGAEQPGHVRGAEGGGVGFGSGGLGGLGRCAWKGQARSLQVGQEAPEGLDPALAGGEGLSALDAVGVGVRGVAVWLVLALGAGPAVPFGVHGSIPPSCPIKRLKGS